MNHQEIDRQVVQARDFVRATTSAALCVASLTYLNYAQPADVMPRLGFAGCALIFTSALYAKNKGYISANTEQAIQSAALVGSVACRASFKV